MWTYLGAGVSAASDEVVLRIRTNKSVYKLNEPVKCVVTLVNNSETRQHLHSISDMTMNMDFMYYEVRTPANSVELRNSKFIAFDRAWDSRHAGESVLPGDSVMIYLYPHVTRLIRHERQPNPTRTAAVMFSSLGVYTVRLFYQVPRAYPKLWQPPGGELGSNVLEIEIVGPDEIEEEIFDAYWSGSPEGAALLGEMNPHTEFDEARLKRLIEQYPDDPAIRYAYYALGRSMTRIVRGNAAPEANDAIAYLNYLVERHPDFRFEEVRKHLGTAFYYSGDRERALVVYTNALEIHPELRDCYRFMVRYISMATGDYSMVYEWRKSRARGEKRAPMEREVQE